MTWTPSLKLLSGLFKDKIDSLIGRPPQEQRLSREQIAAISRKREVPKEKEIPLASYPRRFSWLDAGGENYMTPVKNQGFCSSCVAFGSLAVLETMARISKHLPMEPAGRDALLPLSEGQTFYTSPGYSWKPAPQNHNGLTGWTIDKALNFLRDTGAIPARFYPYKLKARRKFLPPHWEEMTTRLSGYHILREPGRMKEWIAAKGPLLAAITLHPDIYFYSGGIYEPSVGPALGGHCICVVGYDEERQAWLCKNSWSSHWGEQGYCWIAYGACDIDTKMWAVEGLSRIYEIPGEAI